MPKFYLTKNAARSVKAGSKTFTFSPVEYFAPTSSYWGTYSSSDEGDIELLDAAVAAGAITVISEDDYAVFEVKKKKVSDSISSVQLRNKLPPQQVAFSGRPAAVVEEPVVLPSDGPVLAETVEEVLAPKPSKKTNKK